MASFIQNASKVLDQISSKLNLFSTVGGGLNSQLPKQESKVDIFGGKECCDRILDVLQDVNRGVWSLVNAISSGHLGSGDKSTFEPLMPANPPNTPPPTPPKEPNKLDSFIRAFTQAMDSAGGGHELKGMGKALDDSANAVGGAATAIFGPEVGVPVRATMEFGGALLKATDRLKEMGDQLHQSNMQFAEFSGSMAGVQARAEIREISLKQQRGERRSGMAEYNAKSQDFLDRHSSGLVDVWVGGFEAIVGTVKYIGGALLAPANAVATKVGEIVGLIKPAEQVNNFQNFTDWVGFEIGEYGVPSRMKDEKGKSP